MRRLIVLNIYVLSFKNTYKGVGTMTNNEKARKLYEECGVNPEESTLIPMYYFDQAGQDIVYRAMIVGTLINRYATGKTEGDFIPVTRESLHVGDWDKEGWKLTQSSIYRLEKKKFIETIEKDGQKYIRLTNDDFYNPEIYKRKSLVD